MRRNITGFLIIFICFLLQSTVCKWIEFGGIAPNLLIIITSAIGFMRNEKSGLVVGFFCGILVDIFYGDIIGFYALLYMYIGYVNGKFSHVFFSEDIKLPLALISMSDLSFGFLCYVFLYFLQGKLDFPYYLFHIIIPEMVYTIVISIGMYPALLKIYKKLDAKDRSESRLV